MANVKISAKKAGISLVTVLAGFVVAVGANAAAKASGIELTADQQSQAAVAITAAVTGLATGVMNWWKHRPRKIVEKKD